MKFSVITPSFNSGDTIEQTIESVQNQVYLDVEHIVVDGGSTDQTLSILNKYSSLKWVSEPDKGIYDAMNKGVKLASGDWIIFLGADDIFFGKEVLSILLQKYREVLATYKIVYGGVIFKELYSYSSYHKRFHKFHFDRSNLNHQSIFYHQSVFKLVGDYNLKYPVFADWEFNIKAFFNSEIKTSYIPLIISVFSVQGASNTRIDSFLDHRTELIQSMVDKDGLRSKLSFELYQKSRQKSLRVILLKILKRISFIK